MALDDAYQGEINEALRNRAQLAPIAPGPERGFSFWGMAKAPFTGAAAGAVEAGAFLSDTVGAFGSAMASTGTTGVLPFAETEEQRIWREQGAGAARKALDEGTAFSSDTGDTLRDASRWLGPNPQTASTAEQMMFGFAKTITKAVGYTVATGNPLTGAMLTGADEGVTASDELRRQGVDLATRASVGAVTGVTTGVGVALPVAGKTLAGTLGYAAGGGPGLFIAQQQMTRDILNNADYSNLADQYDPFDPVGLAVSTLVPAAFGAWALRGRTRAAAREGQPAPVAAQAAEGAEAPRGPMQQELVDAARVQRVREVVDSWNLGDASDVRAANDAMMSVMRASSQMADGLSVYVADQFPMKDAYAARALETMVSRSEAARAELLPQAEALADPGAIRALRTEIQELAQARRSAGDDVELRALADQIRANEPRTGARAALNRARQELDARAQETDARIAALEAQIESNAEAMAARQALAVLDERIEQMRAERAAIDAPATAMTPVAAGVREAARAAESPFQIPERGRQPAAARAEAGGTLPGGQEFASGTDLVTPTASRADVDPIAPPAKLPTTTAQATSDAYVTTRLAEIEAAQPDLPVRMDGDAEDVPLSEAIRRLNEQLARDDADADLLAVAANCFISAA
ncbi:hypothetical protein [Achromobacter sp. MFA1 R4]|uniref:hypothetical protein n=1 Tax=Achromobacter sp. MFA1 R4 TaxID=1881016 RepID=UPI0009536C02|nr:hypothetical protein [Achromobacter sp. MFA1 R4]SIT25403.1 hypothetical protein SAMN05428937_3020 [Achromobacter sp. MFA1 R4]